MGASVYRSNGTASKKQGGDATRKAFHNFHNGHINLTFKYRQEIQTCVCKRGFVKVPSHAHFQTR